MCRTIGREVGAQGARLASGLCAMKMDSNEARPLNPPTIVLRAARKWIYRRALGPSDCPRTIRRLSIHGSVVGNAFATPAIPGAPPDILYRGISGIVKPEKNGDFIPEMSKRTLTAGIWTGRQNKVRSRRTNKVIKSFPRVNFK